MALLDVVEEALTDSQSPLLNHRVQTQQHLAQRFHLRQVGHLRALSERGQLLQQSGEFLTLGRMLAPAAQQIFGIQQDVHAFREEQRDHARIAGLTSIVMLAGAGFDQSGLMQGVHLGQELRGAFYRRQRFVIEIGQPLA